MPKENYAERRQNRIDRYESLAVKSAVESDQLSQQSIAMTRQTNGQPVIVGRSTTADDIRFREQASRKMEESARKADQSEYWENRAAAAKNNKSISSDDPEAIPKLKEKLAELIQRHTWNIELNKYYRKNKTCVGYDGLTEQTAQERIANRPVPTFRLQNETAEINRIHWRIKQLTAAESATYEDFSFDGGAVVHNKTENRIQVRFMERPDEKTRSRLKSNGYRWSPTEGAWQVMLSPANGRLVRNMFPPTNK